MEPLAEEIKEEAKPQTKPTAQDGSVYYPAAIRIREGALGLIIKNLTEKGGFVRGGQPRIYVFEGKLLIEIPCNAGEQGGIEYVAIDVSMKIP
jgi:hypothetical protein